MMLKNLFTIINSYKLSLITIVFFEILYLIKGYKGNRFNFSDNEYMANNLPTPYYFLFKIKKTLENNNFSNFIDLGCGSGRTIDFFNKNFYNKNFIGIEYFSEQYEYCRKIFQSKNNIKIIQTDFTKLNFFQYNADCYFFNNPFKKDLEFIKFIKRVINFSLKKKYILFIFVNFNKKNIENLANIQCIKSFYINDTKGYSICSLNNN